MPLSWTTIFRRKTITSYHLSSESLRRASLRGNIFRKTTCHRHRLLNSDRIRHFVRDRTIGSISPTLTTQHHNISRHLGSRNPSVDCGEILLSVKIRNYN
jgi:hypothetical protein